MPQQNSFIQAGLYPGVVRLDWRIEGGTFNWQVLLMKIVCPSTPMIFEWLLLASTTG